jgi:hypothetical protein
MDWVKVQHLPCSVQLAENKGREKPRIACGLPLQYEVEIGVHMYKYVQTGEI